MSRTKKRVKHYTHNDNSVIMKAIQTHGTSKGAKVAARLLGRTESGVSQHFYAKLNGGNPISVQAPTTIKVTPPYVDETTTETDTSDEIKSVQMNVKGVEIYMVFK
jgi:hypothetical protein